MCRVVIFTMVVLESDLLSNLELLIPLLIEDAEAEARASSGEAFSGIPAEAFMLQEADESPREAFETWPKVLSVEASEELRPRAQQTTDTTVAVEDCVKFFQKYGVVAPALFPLCAELLQATQSAHAHAHANTAHTQPAHTSQNAHIPYHKTHGVDCPCHRTKNMHRHSPTHTSHVDKSVKVGQDQEDSGSLGELGSLIQGVVRVLFSAAAAASDAPVPARRRLMMLNEQEADPAMRQSVDVQ